MSVCVLCPQPTKRVFSQVTPVFICVCVRVCVCVGGCVCVSVVIRVSFCVCLGSCRSVSRRRWRSHPRAHTPLFIPYTPPQPMLSTSLSLSPSLSPSLSGPFITVCFVIIFLYSKPHFRLVEIDSSDDTNQVISPFIPRSLLIAPHPSVSLSLSLPPPSPSLFVCLRVG